MIKTGGVKFSLLILIVFSAAMFPQFANACAYCASTTSVCVSYEDRCISYSQECTGYSQVCDYYEDVCYSYDYVCDAYDDNGDCVSYSTVCTDYGQQCGSYSYQCDGYQTICDGYQSECTQYEDQCNSYYYGDYLTVAGIARSAQTGYLINNAAVSLVSLNSNSQQNIVHSFEDGSYSNSLFVLDDSYGYLNAQVCVSSNSSSTPVCQNVSAYDSCSQPVVRRDATISLDKLKEPTSFTIAATSDTALTASWSLTFESTAGYYISIAQGSIASDCTEGIDIGYSSSYIARNLRPNTQYSFSICSYDRDGNISREALAFQTTKRTPPPTPSALILNSTSTSSVNATWTSGGGSTSGFVINIAAGNVAPNCVSGRNVNSNVNALFNSLTSGTLYSVSLCSYDAFGNYSTAVTGTARTKFAVPPVPSITTISSTSPTTITVAWSSNGGTTSGYLYKLAAGSSAPNCSGGTSTFDTSNVFSGLTPATAYSLSVCAVNPDGVASSPASTTQSTQHSPPPAPVGLTIVATSPTEMTANWSSGGGATSGYFFAYSAGTVAPNCHSGIDVQANTTYNLQGLNSATTYSVAICAYDTFNDSSDSSPLIASQTTLRTPPPVPTNFSLSAASSTQLNASWISGGGSTSNFYYNIATGSVAPDCKQGTSVGLVAAKSITGLTENTTYTVSLCAKDNFGLYSTQVSATQTTPRMPPPAVTNFSLRPYDTRIKATWTSGGGTTTGFRLAIKQGSQPENCVNGKRVGLVESTFYNALQPNTQYTISICAIDIWATRSIQSNITITTLRTPPPAPTGLVVTPFRDTRVTVSWISGQGTTLGFKLAKAVGTTAPSCATGVNVGNVQAYTVINLTPNTQYTFSLCAYDSFGTYSSVLVGSGTTLRTPPPTPQGLRFTAVGRGEMTINWNASGGTTSGYYLRVRKGAQVYNCKTGIDLGLVTSYRATALTPGNLYTVTLCAHDIYGTKSGQVIGTQSLLP